MKYIIIFSIVLPHLPVSAQQNRKTDTEIITKMVYSVIGFQQMADSLQLSVDELCDYPVIFPVKNPVISSGFGMRRHPVSRLRKFHTGIDIAKVRGTPVHATGNGVVIRKGYTSGYGIFIEIQHSGGFRSFYAHLSKTLVNTGDSVNITQQIACVGNTGLSTGCHLHYEIRKGNRYLNPTGWCYYLPEYYRRIEPFVPAVAHSPFSSPSL